MADSRRRERVDLGEIREQEWVGVGKKVEGRRK